MRVCVHHTKLCVCAYVCIKNARRENKMGFTRIQWVVLKLEA
jgi:hypothetical protein